MHFLKRYQANHVFRDGVRYHCVPGTFEIVPGVTSVLSKTKSVEAAIAIENWRKGKTDAQQKEAILRGNAMHILIEKDLAPSQVSDADLRKAAAHPTAHLFYQSLSHVFEEIGDVWLVEGAIWHPAGYAGSVDCLAIHEGELTLLDWKTSSKPKKRDWIEDYFQQAAAYCKAIEHVYEIPVGRAAICVALEGAEAQIFDIHGKEIEEFFLKFLDRAERFKTGDWTEI